MTRIRRRRINALSSAVTAAKNHPNASEGCYYEEVVPRVGLVLELLPRVKLNLVKSDWEELFT